MILAALVRYYESLLAAGEIAAPGWSPVNVSYAIQIDDLGNIKRIISLKEEMQQGKKTVFRPRKMLLPTPPKRSSGIKPAFLCDNAAYIFGYDKHTNDNTQSNTDDRSRLCFQASSKYHETILKAVDHPAAKALLAYFKKWDPDKIEEVADLSNLGGDIFTSTFIFRYDGENLQDIPDIIDAWQKFNEQNEANANRGICLVTGKETPLARLHPAIKGVRGAQTAGASLVSFNVSAFCSYGKEQGANAPTGEYAAFAYTSALNYLLANLNPRHYIGDTAILCWAEGGEKTYQDFFDSYFFDDESHYEENEYKDMINSLVKGSPVLFDNKRIDPDHPFYVLGLAPNAARLSVRFFLTNSFGDFLRHLLDHQKRLEIAHNHADNFTFIPLWMLLRETTNENAKTKTISPLLGGEVLRAILNDTHYPASLLNGVNLRIHADRKVNRFRAAILKAYYLQNPHKDVPEKEVLSVSLNPNSKSVPYNLGRLFAVLEAIQKAANPGINSTIRDRFFNAAASTPASTFPVLINLTQKHLKKLERDAPALKKSFDQKILSIYDLLDEAFPSRFSLQEQGAFQLGYYHQTVSIYTPKDKEETQND